MSAAIATATPTADGGSDPPAQHHMNDHQDQIVKVSTVPDPTADDGVEQQSKGVHVLVVQGQAMSSPRTPASPGGVALLNDAATPGLVKELRGWLMVLATLVASITYSSGLSPPGGFEKVNPPTSKLEQGMMLAPTPPAPASGPPRTMSDPHNIRRTPGEQMIPLLFLVSPARCRTFYYSNTAAFALSLSIIVLLGSQDLRKLAKIKALEILVGLDLMALLVAYIAAASFGSLQLLVCAALVLVVPVALVVMSSRLCGKYFWDDL